MKGRKPGDAGCVDCGYRQFDQAHLRQRGEQLGRDRSKIFASERALDRDFPNTRALLAAAHSRKWVSEFTEIGVFLDQELVYGTTQSGGTSNQGTVFSMAKNGTGFLLLKSFDGCSTLIDGCNPFAGLIEGSDTKLYGTTISGGTSNQGTVFSIAKNGTGVRAAKEL